MKYSSKLLVLLFPFVVLPPLIVASLFWVYAWRGLSEMSHELLFSQLSTFEAQVEQEYSVLRRLELEEIDFYRANTQRRVITAAREIDLVGSALFFILDGEGEQLYPEAMQIPEGVRREIINSPESFEGYREGARFKRRAYLGRSIPFEHWNWSLGILMPEEDVYRPIRNATRGATAVFIIIVLLSLLVGNLLGRSLSQPLQVLLNTTMRLGEGELSARAELPEGDEFGQLAKAYNKMAENLEQFNQRLEQRVAERTRELNDSLAVLRSTQHQLVEKEKMAALGSLVAGIAHEINTPLGVGVTAASFLRRRSEQVGEEFAADRLSKKELDNFLKTSLDSSEIISRNLERAHELIKNFKQLATDQSTSGTRVIVVGRYIRDVIRSLGPEFKSFQVESVVDCEEELRIDAPAGLLAQVITNLVINSLTHGFDESKAGSIHIGVRRSREILHLTYFDNGRGMDAHTRQHLFEPFFTTRRGQGGSGLGMNIVYNIVNQHLRGTIQVDSEPGHGVRYDIRFPARFV